MDQLTIESFAPHLETDFALEDPARGGRIALRLHEVRGLGRQPNAPRTEPFTLIFTGPPQPTLVQRTYQLAHPELGPLELFLVPVGTDEAGMLYYEAVFN